VRQKKKEHAYLGTQTGEDKANDQVKRETSGKWKDDKSSMKQQSYAELNAGKDRWDTALFVPTGDNEGK
jgi:hypothetical protein